MPDNSSPLPSLDAVERLSALVPSIEIGWGNPSSDERDRERRLFVVLLPLADRDNQGVIVGYSGWRSGTLPRPLLKALGAAIPFPADLSGAWAERNKWTALNERRRAFRASYRPPPHIRARQVALTDLLNLKPAPTLEGIYVRLAWLQTVIEDGVMFDRQAEMTVTASLLRDFGAYASKLANSSSADNSLRELAATSSIPRKSYRSNAEKQRDVLELLSAEPQLSDRTIGKLCGVSAQTVGNWRRRKSLER